MRQCRHAHAGNNAIGLTTTKVSTKSVLNDGHSRLERVRPLWNPLPRRQPGLTLKHPRLITFYHTVLVLLSPPYGREILFALSRSNHFDSAVKSIAGVSARALLAAVGLIVRQARKGTQTTEDSEAAIRHFLPLQDG